MPEAVFFAAGAAAFFATGFLAAAVVVFALGAAAFLAAGAFLAAPAAGVFLGAAALVAVFLGATFSLPADDFCWVVSGCSCWRRMRLLSGTDLGSDLDSATETLGENQVTLVGTSLDGVVQVGDVRGRGHVDLVLLGEVPGSMSSCMASRAGSELTS